MMRPIKSRRKIQETLVYPVVQMGIKNPLGNTWTEAGVNKILELYESKKGNLLGEVCHSIGDGGKFITTLSNVSHIVEDLYRQDDFLLVKIRFIKNKSGDFARDLILNNQAFINLTISGRVSSNLLREIEVFGLSSVDILPVPEIYRLGQISQILWEKVK